eukprot:scaffold20310_cov125-Isochrysis_galbana.AAC.23
MGGCHAAGGAASKARVRLSRIVAPRSTRACLPSQKQLKVKQRRPWLMPEVSLLVRVAGLRSLCLSGLPSSGPVRLVAQPAEATP